MVHPSIHACITLIERHIFKFSCQNFQEPYRTLPFRKPYFLLSNGVSSWNCKFQRKLLRIFQGRTTHRAVGKKICHSLQTRILYVHRASKVFQVVQICPFVSWIFFLRPVLLKFHILARLIEGFPTAYRFWSCVKEKLSFCPYAHAVHSSNEKFPSNHAKTFESRIFFSVLWPIMLKVYFWAPLIESFPAT